MILVSQLLLLLLVANGAPILAHKLLGVTGSCPLDAGLQAWDGRPLLGPTKTVRGILASLLLTGMTALVIGIPLSLGILIAGGAMIGDALSSFTKRRLNMAPSDMALGLDQIPESLLPLLLVAEPLQLGLQQVIITVAGFMVLELVLSRILYRLHIRKRPY